MSTLGLVFLVLGCVVGLILFVRTAFYMANLRQWQQGDRGRESVTHPFWGELHWPGTNFCGPFTRLRQRLARGDQPVHAADACCLAHDRSDLRTKDHRNLDRCLRRVASDPGQTPEVRQAAGRIRRTAASWLRS